MTTTMDEEPEVYVNLIRGVDGGSPGLNLYDVEVIGKEEELQLARRGLGSSKAQGTFAIKKSLAA